MINSSTLTRSFELFESTCFHFHFHIYFDFHCRSTRNEWMIDVLSIGLHNYGIYEDFGRVSSMFWRRLSMRAMEIAALLYRQKPWGDWRRKKKDDALVVDMSFQWWRTCFSFNPLDGTSFFPSCQFLSSLFGFNRNDSLIVSIQQSNGSATIFFLLTFAQPEFRLMNGPLWISSSWWIINRVIMIIILSLFD